MVGGNVYYSLFQHFAVVKLCRKITWEVSIELNMLFFYLIKETQLSVFYVDLSETTYIDSTILGTLVHFKKQASDQNIQVILCSPSNVCETILNDVGLNKVLTINKTPPPAAAANTNELPLGKKISPAEIEQLIKQAHEELSGLNDKNKKMFSSVVDVLNNGKSE